MRAKLGVGQCQRLAYIYLYMYLCRGATVDYTGSTPSLQAGSVVHASYFPLSSSTTLAGHSLLYVCCSSPVIVGSRVLCIMLNISEEAKLQGCH